jgi:hypothetical protein
MIIAQASRRKFEENLVIELVNNCNSQSIFFLEKKKKLEKFVFQKVNGEVYFFCP